MMSKKEIAEHRRLTRRILFQQKVTMKQVRRAFELQRQFEAEART